MNYKPRVEDRCSNLKIRNFENGGVAVMFIWWEEDKLQNYEGVYASKALAAEAISEFVTETGEWE